MSGSVLSPRSLRRLEMAGLMLGSGISGCHSWRVESTPLPETLAARRPDRIQVRGADTAYVELRHPSLVGDSIIGEARADHARIAVALGDIQQVRIRRPDAVKTVGLVAAIVGVTFVAATIADNSSGYFGDAP
jgi:hypothetical protein